MAERFAPGATRSLNGLSGRAIIEPQRLQDFAPKPARSRSRALVVASIMTSLVPTAEEISVLHPVERFGFHLTQRMNFGGWKRFWTWCQRHIGSLWIYLATYNLMNVFGIANLENTDPSRPVVLVANHRSFFDMYTVSSVMFRRTKRPITLYFPVRAKFFYDSPVGWFVNLIIGWWSAALPPPRMALWWSTAALFRKLAPTTSSLARSVRPAH